MINQIDLPDEYFNKKISPYIRSELMMETQERGKRVYNNKEILPYDFRVLVNEIAYNQLLEIEKCYNMLPKEKKELKANKDLYETTMLYQNIYKLLKKEICLILSLDIFHIFVISKSN